MSRSYRKTPAGGLTTAASDKPFKVESSRRLRHNVNQEVRELAKNPELADDVVLAEKGRDLTNPYDAPKDGHKGWWGFKDTEWYKKLMRK